MALVRLASVGTDSVVLSADIVSGVVVGAQLVVAGVQSVEAQFNGSGGQIFSGSFPPGTHAVSLPRNKRFAFDETTPVRMSLTVRWP